MPHQQVQECVMPVYSSESEAGHAENVSENVFLININMINMI